MALTFRYPAKVDDAVDGLILKHRPAMIYQWVDEWKPTGTKNMDGKEMYRRTDKMVYQQVFVTSTEIV